MTHICPKCGALLLEDGAQCSFCSTPFAFESEMAPAIAPAAARNSDVRPTRRDDLRAIPREDARTSRREHATAAAAEPEWRREVARRLDEYRVRRGKVRPNDSQAGFSFQEISLGPAESLIEEPRQAAPRARPSPQKTYSNERVEIRIQPELAFESAATRSRPQNLLVPAASIRRRAAAALLDAAFVALACAGFVALFRSLGGAIALGKTDALICAAAAFLFYVLYFSLFTWFAGSTPGMQICALTVVRLDGSLAEGDQLAWRSFGYALSAAALMLGFAWAFWDEDAFTWQDRISQTYVTAAAPIANAAAFEIAAVPRRRFAHR